jgi:NTP pyrophosphatase (non-canonical NTP hydrolase)
MEALIQKLRKFNEDRDWSQFHDSKNLALAISIEAAELNELFLWKNKEDSEMVDKERLSEELADVFAYGLLLADKHGLNIEEIVTAKMNKNSAKYPIEKAKGKSDKYNQL